ncbi:hypothetical protein F3Y22_tig00000340pilonHSYRG00428 [Hibiscus syriacus]|uniref:CCHC-type domain-containing protein n=1 Tax=Hibiscus syriacus TaxID=106335 RepID=A0A6A3D123_HIBSY|nr:hypothetical protein F3Y22_tig00000340pilonHSYRG00428 [Hibiscus syriacus]
MAADEGKVKIEKQALGVIRLTLSRNVAFNIAKEKTTAGLMTALSSMYEKPSASNKVHLMSWNATVTTVSSSSGNSKLKFDDVRDLVLSEEIRRRESGEASTSSALHTESRGRTLERNSNRGRSKSRRGKSRTGNKYFTCYNCGKKGHFKRDCRAPKKNTGAQESANMTDETGDAMILSVNSPIESWILDSGASFHSTPCQEIMENYVSSDFGKVHLADDETLKIVGKGDIRLKLPNQTTWKLTGVRHIPGLKRNLISVGQLDGEGYSTTFSGCEWKITKGALVIARGKKTDTLYVTSNLENIITVADVDGKSNLWHQRLGHMSEKGMKILLSKGKLPDLKNVDVGLCEYCIFGKQKKVDFAKIGKTPKAKRLELVHTDVWGPSPVPSLAGSLYYVTFIDDSTRKMWVYFLKKKSEVFDTFRKWKVMVENENGLKVKRLSSPNTAAECVAERMNRTLNERARSMRIHAGLPKFLWAEAINTAAYLINRGPSVPLDGGIPEEAWSKKEINLSHLRVFGCISYVHINSVERSKLDAKSNKCVFVGYGGDEFSYRFWDYENRKIIRSRDVIFNKNVMYKDRSTAESSNTEAETKEFTEFEEISGNDCYDEAMQVEDSVKWESSMKDEMDSLMSNQTWELAELPPGKKALHNKWIYRIKEEHDGSKRYKARLVVKGFQQKEDVKTAFLHGDLEEEIYMRQPEGFIEAQTCKIINLKQKLSKQFAMKDLGAAKQILGMRIKRDTKSGTLILSQAEYINKVLSRFNMQDAKPVSTPLGVHFRLSKEQSPKTEEERAHMVKVPYASAIGSLMYAMVCTRPYIAQAVGAVSRHMNNLGKVHWEAVKWILRYLRGTTNKTLCFKGGDTILTGYVDADLTEMLTSEGVLQEYVAVTEASKEMVWLQSFLEELGKKQENNVLYCDSQISSGRWILKLEKISGAQNPADMLTKTVTTYKLKLCSTSVGMLDYALVRKVDRLADSSSSEIALCRAVISLIAYNGYFQEYTSTLNNQNESTWSLEREFNLWESVQVMQKPHDTFNGRTSL